MNLMVISASDEACIVIRKAQEMGHRVLAIDGNPDAPGREVADCFMIASTYDTAAATKAAVEAPWPIHGVMAAAADVPWTVAAVATELGICHTLDLPAAYNVSNKVSIARRLEGNVFTPKYALAYQSDDLTRIVAKEIPLPVVIKPVDSRGARGVQLIKNRKELGKAWDRAIIYSQSHTLMVQEYLDGPQLSTEGVMLHGKAYIPAIFDRNYDRLEQFKPYFVEDGGEMPSRYSPEINDEVVGVMEKAAKALGIEHGPIKGDLVIHDSEIYVIEIAGRLSGGYFGTVATEASTGVSLVEVGIKTALGLEVNPEELEPKWNKGAAIRFAFPNSGKLIDVSPHPNHITSGMSGRCKYAHVFIKPEEMIGDYESHPDRAGVVVFDASTREDAVTWAKEMINSWHWEIQQ